jgi:DNA-binding MarR family transcriptional regulator
MATTRNKAAGLRLLMQLARVHHSQIRASQLELLLTVWLHPGLTQTELADELGLTTSAISRSVDVLGSAGRKDGKSTARLGLLTADLLADDGINDQRAKHVRLTAAGERLVITLLNAAR